MIDAQSQAEAARAIVLLLGRHLPLGTYTAPSRRKWYEAARSALFRATELLSDAQKNEGL